MLARLWAYRIKGFGRATGSLAMSALPPGAIKSVQTRCAISRPEQVQQQSVQKPRLLDHLVGAGEQRRRHFDAEHPRRLSVDNKLELRRLHDRQIRRLCALEDAPG